MKYALRNPPVEIVAKTVIFSDLAVALTYKDVVIATIPKNHYIRSASVFVVVPFATGGVTNTLLCEIGITGAYEDDDLMTEAELWGASYGDRFPDNDPLSPADGLIGRAIVNNTAIFSASASIDARFVSNDNLNQLTAGAARIELEIVKHL
jgi:hypothetical protein